MLSEYVWGLNLGGGIGGLLDLKQSSLNYSYLYDGKGSVTALLNGGQSVVAAYTYDAFGTLMPETGSLSQPFQFSTKPYDEETGLSYFGYRFYALVIGRWITQDPIGYAGGMNLYAYVGNNPVNWVDPQGLWGEDVHSGIGNPNDGTYIWAIQVGLTSQQARVIAIANNSTDGGFGSWMPIIGDQSRHFNQGKPFMKGSSDSRDFWAQQELLRAVESYKKSDCEAALGHLGKELHSIQDEFAHRDWDTGRSGTHRHPDWYDTWADPRNSSARSLTEAATKDYLLRYLDLTGQR